VEKFYSSVTDKDLHTIIPPEFVCWYLICEGVNIRGACASGTLTFRLYEIDHIFKSSGWGYYEYMYLSTDEAEPYTLRPYITKPLNNQYISIMKVLDYLKETIQRLTLTVSYEQIKAKLREYYIKWEASNNPQDIERYNIEMFRLFRLLEKAEEYAIENQNKLSQWKRDNDNANREAFETISNELKTMTDEELAKKLERRPELRFLLKSKEEIIEEDFSVVSTSHLSISEARAVYYKMPSFDSDDYSLQYQFVENLMERINNLKSSNVPIPATTKIVIKTTKSEGGSRDLFQELLQKRRRKN